MKVSFDVLATNVGGNEGPVFTRSGSIVVTSMERGALYEVDPHGAGARQLVVLGGNPNGLTEGLGGRLYIAPSSTLTIYAGGTVNLSGAGVINGATSPNLTLYGLPTCTNITITASANFIGSVYAPEANVTISGASPFFGSCICRTASLAGSGVFHYDQALSGVTGSTGYYLSYWHEVTP